MLATSFTSAVLLALLAALDYSGAVQVWHVITIAALFSLVTGIDWPARASVYPLLVSHSAFMSAVALNSFLWQATRMALPALGGLLIGITGTWLLFALAAAGFMVMFVTMLTLTIRTTEKPSGSAKEQFVTGLRFVWHTQTFRWLFFLSFVGMFCCGSFVQIMPVFADLVGGGETAYGYLLTAGGIGSVLGTLLLGGAGQRLLGRIIFLGAALNALTAIAFAWAASLGSYYGALAFALITAAFASGFHISSLAVLQLAVPDELRGRVMGLHTVTYSMVALGGLLLGALAEMLSPGMAVTIGCSIYLGALSWALVSRSELWQLENEGGESAPG